MEINYNNFINTTSMLTVSDATSSAKFLFLNDLRFEYGTTNFADDDTTASITVSFDTTTTVDRIAMVNHNLKKYKIFYNGITANTFNMTTASDTTSSDYSTNSETAQYFRVTSTDVTSVTFDMQETQNADENKRIGYLVITENRTYFNSRVPPAGGYRPLLTTKAVNHNLADGTVRTQVLEDNWSASLSFNFIDTETRDELKEIYDDHASLIFAPFGTTTSWDAVLFPCNWVGGFDFFRFSDNAAASGFSGTINFKETSSL